MLLENVANRAITNMLQFKAYASKTLIFRKQAPLNVDDGNISLYGRFLELNKNEKQSKSIVYSLW